MMDIFKADPSDWMWNPFYGHEHQIAAYLMEEWSDGQISALSYLYGVEHVDPWL